MSDQAAAPAPRPGPRVPAGWQQPTDRLLELCGGTTPEITLDATRTTPDIQAYSGQTADLLNLRAYSAVGLGSVLFGVSNTGAVTLAGGPTVAGGGAAITGHTARLSATLSGPIMAYLAAATLPLVRVRHRRRFEQRQRPAV